jgi:hypothetical protein
VQQQNASSILDINSDMRLKRNDLVSNLNKEIDFCLSSNNSLIFNRSNNNKEINSNDDDDYDNYDDVNRYFSQLVDEDESDSESIKELALRLNVDLPENNNSTLEYKIELNKAFEIEKQVVMDKLYDLRQENLKVFFYNILKFISISF